MRLFIAVLPDEQMKDAVSAIISSLKEEKVAGRYVSEEQMHITLAFIGEYGNPQKVMNALEEVSFAPFDMKIGKIGMFDDLCMCTVEGEGLEKCAASVRRKLAEHGIPFDRKKFIPHMTLVRRAVFRKDNVYPAVEIPDCVMTVSEISLMRSDRTKKGMIYTEIDAVEADC